MYYCPQNLCVFVQGWEISGLSWNICFAAPKIIYINRVNPGKNQLMDWQLTDEMQILSTICPPGGATLLAVENRINLKEPVNFQSKALSSVSC